MRTVHKIALLAGLSAAALDLFRRHAKRVRDAEAVRRFDERVGARTYEGRASIDDVPVVQPAEPFEPGQQPQPQDLRIAQNVLE
jgi:hypothetical protein